MTASSELVTRQEFVEAVAQAAQIAVEDVADGRTTLAELPIDSLAFAEVIVTLVIDFDMGDLSADLATRDWRVTTVNDLYFELSSGSRTGQGRVGLRTPGGGGGRA